MCIRSSAFLFLFLLVINSLYAQEDTIPSANLQEVVVTGQYKPQSVKNSVYQVRVINREQIQRQAASRLQDVLNTQLNIRFSQDVATGGSDINMMGLSGQNVKILIDGVPMIGRQGTSNEININQIEVNAIERIEIIEGPMSVIYGADALAGVINIITRKPGRSRLAVNLRVHEETVGREYGWEKGIHNQFLGLSGNFKNWYASGGIGRNLFQGWQDTATGRELVWHKKDQIIANAVIGYRNDKLNIYYRVDGLDEIITNPANPPADQTIVQAAIDQDYMTQRLMQQVQANYRFSSLVSANALASYTHFTRQVYSTLYYPNGDVRVATAPGLHSLSTFNGFTFRTTAVIRPSAKWSLQPGADINLERGEGERIKVGNQQINDYAFFITAEYTPNDRINIRPGLRFIKNSVYKAPPVVPSVNAKFGISKSLDLRLAYARGFRSPSLRELYYDFFDASHSIMGNPDLEAEQSHSLTGSLSWTAKQVDDKKILISLNGFYNDVDNMISYAPDAANRLVTTYVNIDRYKTRGFTINGDWQQKNLKANLGAGYTGRYNEYKSDFSDLPSFKWSPEITAAVSWTFTKLAADINLFYKYTGRLPYYELTTINGAAEATLVEAEGYQWADLTINKKLGKLLTLNAGIRNLFDVTAVNSTATNSGGHNAAGARPVGYGRSYFLGLQFQWTKK